MCVVVFLCPVGHFDEQSAGPRDEQRQQAVRGDEVGVDAEPENSQAVVQVVFPDRPVPCRRVALEHLGAPDVVDQDVDGAVVVPDAIGEGLHLCDVEVVDLDRDADATE